MSAATASRCASSAENAPVRSMTGIARVARGGWYGIIARCCLMPRHSLHELVGEVRGRRLALLDRAGAHQQIEAGFPVLFALPADRPPGGGIGRFDRGLD